MSISRESQNHLPQNICVIMCTLSSFINSPFPDMVPSCTLTCLAFMPSRFNLANRKHHFFALGLAISVSRSITVSPCQILYQETRSSGQKRDGVTYGTYPSDPKSSADTSRLSQLSDSPHAASSSPFDFASYISTNHNITDRSC